MLTPQGDLRVLLDEGDPEKVDALEQAVLRRHVTEDVLFATGRGIAPWMASVTFGGPDLRTVYIGSLKGKRIPYFRAPVAGLPMVHWNERRMRPQGSEEKIAMSVTAVATQLEQVTKNVYTTTKIRGCNPSIVFTSEGAVFIDTAQWITTLLEMKAFALERGPRSATSSIPRRTSTTFSKFLVRGRMPRWWAARNCTRSSGRYRAT